MAVIHQSKVLVKINEQRYWYSQSSLFESAWNAMPKQLQYKAQEVYVEEEPGVFKCFKNVTSQEMCSKTLTDDEVLVWMLGAKQLDISTYRRFSGTASGGPG